MADQGNGRVQSPPFATGQLLCPTIEQFGKAEQFGELVDRGTGLAATHPGQAREQPQIVATGEGRIDTGLLGSEAEIGPSSPRIGKRIDPTDHDTSGVRAEQTSDDRHQCGLARPVSTQEGRDLPRRDLQVDRVQCLIRPVCL